ncbi:MAG: DUF4476 domain-containing protein [Bacteroidaceae bacterium]|nr:DUF4476 domain-containing protein [Bacteroidaceae bacterium]
MKQTSKIFFILALCAWMGSETNLLSASVTSRTSATKKVEVLQHRPRHERPHHRSPIMNERDFQFLYKTIKRKSFSEGQLELLSVGVLDNYFSCRQCAKLMSLFTFEKAKLEALDIMADHIVDKEKAHLILDSFKFDSGKREAARMLGLHRR